jgi:hypothetical protein
MSKKNKGLNRRGLLKGMCAAAASAAASPALFGALRSRSAQAAGPGGKPPKFLIVLGGFGGASIIDSFMAQTHTGVGDNFANINCFPDNEVTQVGAFTAVKTAGASIGQLPFAYDTDQNPFVTKHQNDMMVVTQTGTSVNHVVAQKRSLTGNGAWQGRTLQEAMACEYGADMPLPNVNMASMGYLEHGTDPSLPAFAYNEPVAQPALWPLSLDAAKGIKDLPGRDVINLARNLRNGKLDPNSHFVKTFGLSERIQRWREQREQQAPLLEDRDLITSLSLLPDAPPTIPLSEFGLMESPDASVVRAVFPEFLTDPLEAQAALAYLLIKNKLTCAVTIAPTFNLVFGGGSVANPPLAFDYSHAGHRGAQAVMWARVLGIADRLITLLKTEEFDGDTGESFWDRSLIYVATDFGRTKKRTNADTVFSTSHDINNGNLIISPMANGGKVLGGVRVDGTTYGYNPQTGAPDTNVEMSESQTYAGILQALDVETTGSGLPDMPAMRKNG